MLIKGNFRYASSAGLGPLYYSALLTSCLFTRQLSPPSAASVWVFEAARRICFSWPSPWLRWNRSLTIATQHTV